MNILGNLNHVFFYVGEKKYPHMFIVVHVWNIFSGNIFFYKAKKKTTHVSIKTYVEFLIKFVNLVNHHTSPMNILGFLPIPKLGLNIRAFSVVMRNTILTTQTKWYSIVDDH